MTSTACHLSKEEVEAKLASSGKPYVIRQNNPTDRNHYFP